MKPKPVSPPIPTIMHAVPPVSHGSAAVRIGGPALIYLLAQAARNGCTARVAAEAIILQHQGAHGHLADKSSPGAAMLKATAAGVDPIEAAVQAVTPKVRAKLAAAIGSTAPATRKTGVGKPKGAPVKSRAVQARERKGVRP